jgi:hypothetical protein
MDKEKHSKRTKQHKIDLMWEELSLLSWFPVAPILSFQVQYLILSIASFCFLSLALKEDYFLLQGRNLSCP